MKKIGTVALILNQDYLLIKAGEIDEFEIGTEVTIYQEYSSQELKEKTNLETIYIPKGTLFITSYQGNNIYLASTIITTYERKLEQENTFKNVLSNLAGYTGNSVERIEQYTKRGTAHLDTENIHKMEITHIVQEKDLVGIEN